MSGGGTKRYNDIRLSIRKVTIHSIMTSRNIGWILRANLRNFVRARRTVLRITTDDEDTNEDGKEDDARNDE